MIETKPIVTLIQEVASATAVGDLTLNYQPGASAQIITDLVRKKTVAIKYPLLAMLTPVMVQRTENGFYGRVRIPLITIATYSELNTIVLDRYSEGGTFLAVLYPFYYEFLKQLSYHELVVNEDDGTFKHTLEEAPGVDKIQNTSDFVDCINIRDLEFNIIQKVNCL